ncbi:MAG TPA: NAD(P)H-binding protein [Croceibacterium sp.]|nr:NAD(P)H-binding protein [Croceibacterium sp.]
MRVVVIGGTGLVGAKLVEYLEGRGHHPVVAARSTGVDISTGKGLSAALEGAEAVVDVSNSGYHDAPGMEAFFEVAGAHLTAAERASEIRHHVVLSAIGADRLDSGFFRAKCRQEEIVADSGVPFTIVRSAPLFEYIYGIVDTVSDGAAVRVPPVRMQPIAAEDVARALAGIVPGRGAGSVIELVGPDTVRLPDLAAEILAANEDNRRVIVDPEIPYFGARIAEEPLIGGAHPRFASTSFDDWLRRSLAVV